MVSLKQYNTQSRTIEVLKQRYSTWHQKCTSQKKENNAHRAVAMTTVMLWELLVAIKTGPVNKLNKLMLYEINN